MQVSALYWKYTTQDNARNSPERLSVWASACVACDDWQWTQWKGSTEERERLNETPEQRWYFHNSLLLSPTIIIRGLPLCLGSRHNPGFPTDIPRRKRIHHAGTLFLIFLVEISSQWLWRRLSRVCEPIGLCAIKGDNDISRSWDKIIAPNGIRELLRRGRELSGKHISAREVQ